MNKFLILIVVLIIAAVAAPFFLNGPDGKPLATVNGMMPTSVIPGAKGAGDTVYKWQDSNGVWQFGEKPPANSKADAIVLSDDAITPLESGWEGEALEQSATKPVIMGSPFGAITQGPEMIEAAKAARDLGNQHNSDLQNIMKEINSQK